MWSCNEAAASDLAADEAFRFKKLVSGGNGGAVQAKRASQFTSGGEASAFGQLAGFNQAGKVRV